MEAALLAIFTLFGMAVGSFLNVCIDRLPLDKSIVSPPSHCDSCQVRLSPKDLVPVFSYLWLRGRCRYCGARIPWRPFLVEIGSGLIFVFTYWQYGISTEFIMAAFYTSLFLVIGLIDLEHGLILDKITFPAAVLAVLIDSVVPPSALIQIQSPWTGIANGLIGAAIGTIFILFPYLIGLVLYKREAMGLGDVKMAALIGLVVGSRLVLVSLLLGSLLGGLVALSLLVFRVKKRTDPLPFGSFLAISTIFTLFYGTRILNWYLGLYGM